ncbi:MAG: translation initiation factor eIF-2B subunit alpha [Icmadophila ericetorum]|nr:translation initiation factor eIF-2B subunit alpha [Icmadophila ericetorum]
MSRMVIVGDVPKANGEKSFEYGSPPCEDDNPWKRVLIALSTYSIVQTYESLLTSDPDLTMPVAAIEALIDLLSQSSSSTVSETLDLLATSTALLKRSIRNPIALSAGTDLFQRYLITTLQRPGNVPGGGDFKTIRQHLLSNGRLFVKRAKESRETIAAYGRKFIRDGSVVLTNGGSRVVGAVLRAAAEAGAHSIRFKVIYVQDPRSTESNPTIKALRELHVPVAVIPDSAVAYSMGKVSIVLVGAEGVVENGGVISRMGTYQMGVLAKSAGKPFYVMAESHKFVRLYPLGQYDLPIEQSILDFTTDTGSSEGSAEGKEGTGKMESEPVAEKMAQKEKTGYFEKTPEPVKEEVNSNSDSKTDAVDYTPPDLITALITESGVHTPSAVSEELIKIWY